MSINKKIEELMENANELKDLETITSDEYDALSEEEKADYEVIAESNTAKKVRESSEDLKVDVSADVAALTSGEDLSEEFKTKAATIFEAAVVSRVKAEVAKLDEEFDTRLNEEIESVEAGLIEKVDGYLDYVVEQWITDNELALENGLKNEILENFVEGMKALFSENYIEVPEDRYDILDELKNANSETQAKLDEQFAANVALSKEITNLHRKMAIKEAAEGMVATDAEKFATMTEELSFEDSGAFKTKLQTIKENYFGKKTNAKPVQSVVTDTPVLNEEMDVNGPMARYVRTINSVIK